MSDWIPVVAQLKSVVQVAAGDKDGAMKTQENFVKRCPILSQTLSTYQLFTGDMSGAKETQLEFLSMLNDTVNSIPVVGHAKGVVHYIAGDKYGGDDAMKSASHTTGTIGGGILGFGLLGPVGAVAGGIAGGAVMDVSITAADSFVHKEDRQYGYVSQVYQLRNKPKDAGQWVDMATTLAFDGIAGHTAAIAFNHQTNKGRANGQKSKSQQKNKKETKGSKMGAGCKIQKKVNSSEKATKPASHQKVQTTEGKAQGKPKITASQSNLSITSVLKDISETSSETVVVVGQVLASTKTILDNSAAGDRLMQNMKGSNCLVSNGREQIKPTGREPVPFQLPTETKVTDISQLQRGEHVKYKRLFGYSHHAIVTNVNSDSNEYEIIHFSPVKSGSKLTDIPFITREIKQYDETLYVLNYEENQRNQREATAAIAETLLNYPNQDRVTVYNFFNNNCEHLATYCVTGYSYSTQAENGKELLRALSKAGMLAVASISKRSSANEE